MQRDYRAGQTSAALLDEATVEDLGRAFLAEYGFLDEGFCEDAARVALRYMAEHLLPHAKAIAASEASAEDAGEIADRIALATHGVHLSDLTEHDRTGLLHVAGEIAALYAARDLPLRRAIDRIDRLVCKAYTHGLDDDGWRQIDKAIEEFYRLRAVPASHAAQRTRDVIRAARQAVAKGDTQGLVAALAAFDAQGS